MLGRPCRGRRAHPRLIDRTPIIVTTAVGRLGRRPSQRGAKRPIPARPFGATTGGMGLQRWAARDGPAGSRRAVQMAPILTTTEAPRWWQAYLAGLDGWWGCGSVVGAMADAVRGGSVSRRRRLPRPNGANVGGSCTPSSHGCAARGAAVAGIGGRVSWRHQRAPGGAQPAAAGARPSWGAASASFEAGSDGKRRFQVGRRWSLRPAVGRHRPYRRGTHRRARTPVLRP